MNITANAQLFPVDIARLTEALYVGPYQLDTPCQGYNTPYKSSIQGWKDGMLKIEQSISKKNMDVNEH